MNLRLLFNKWRTIAQVYRDSHVGGTLTECLDELEAALKPRPIESAPKDGTVVMLWYKRDGYQGWRIGYRENEFWNMHDGFAKDDEISHWLPLPSVGGEE